MAGGPYDAGFTAPDIGPGAALIASVLNSNRANERADEYARMQREAMDRSAERESAEEKRKDEETKRRHQIEAFTQLPLLQRAALRSMKETGSPGYAAANPYGINFAVEQGEAPSLRKAGINVMGGGYGEHAAADLATHGQIGTEGEPNQVPAQVSPAQALLGQSPMLGPTEEATLQPGQEGPEISPALEAARFDEPEASHGPAEEAVEAPSGIDAAQALLGQPRSRKLYATYEGQRFEVPEESDSTGLGPKYDAIYRTMLANMPPGATPQHAFDKVLADYEKDQAESARGARLEKTLGFRNTNREDQQTFIALQNKLYKNEPLTVQDRKDLAEISARAKVAAAGPALKADTANRQDVGALRKDMDDWFRQNSIAIDSKSHKRLSTALANLNSGNAMQQREAAESLVSIFKGGGQVTKASQDLLLHHLAGLVGDAQTWLAKAESGHFGARELNVLKQATTNAMTEEKERMGQLYQSAIDRYGPGSGWEALGANVNHNMRGMFRQFGMEVPDVYQDAQAPISIGSGTRPRPMRPKASTKAADPMKAKAQRALDDPNAPPAAKEAARKILGL